MKSQGYFYTLLMSLHCDMRSKLPIHHSQAVNHAESCARKGLAMNHRGCGGFTGRQLSYQPVSLTSPPSNWYAFAGQLYDLKKNGNLSPVKLLDVVINLKNMSHQVPRFVWVHVASIIRDCVTSLNPQISVRMLHTLAAVQHASPALVFAICENLNLSLLPITWIPALLTTLGALTKLQRKLVAKKASQSNSDQAMLKLPPAFIALTLERSGLPAQLPLLNQQHVSDIVRGISRLESSSDYKHWVSQLLGDMQAAGRVPEFSWQGLVSILHSASKLGIDSHDVLQPYLDQVGHPSVLSQMPVRGLSALIVGIGEMECLGSRRSRCMRAIGIEICKKERLLQLSSWDLTSVWWGLAVVEVSDERVVNSLIEESMKPRRLSSLSEKGLTRVFHSAVQLGVRDAELLKELVDRILIAVHVEEISIVGSAMTLMALKTLNKENPSLWVEEARTIQTDLIRPEKLAESSVTDIDMIMEGLSVFPDPTITGSHGVLWRIKMLSSRGELSQLSSRQLAALIHGLFNLGVLDRLVWNGVLEHVEARTNFWEESRLREIASLSRCLGGLQKRKIANLMDLRPMLNSVCRRLMDPNSGVENLSNVGLGNVVWGLAMGGVGDGLMWGRIVGEVDRRQQQGELSLIQLRNIVSGFVRVSYVSDSTIQMMLERVRNLEDGGNGADLAQLLHTLAKFPQVETSFLRDLMSKLNVASLSNKHLSMTLQTAGQLRMAVTGPVMRIVAEGVSPPRLISYSDTHFAWLLYAMGSLELNRAVTNTVVRAFFYGGHLDQLSWKLLSVALFGLALLNYRSNVEISKILSKLEGPSGFTHLPEGNLVNIFYSLGRLGYSSSDPTWSKLADALCTEKRINSSLTGPRLGALFRTMGKMKLSNEKLDKLLLQTLDADRVGSHPNSVLVNAIYALSRLPYENPDMADEVLREVVRYERLHTLTVLHMVEIIHRLHKLQYSERGAHCIPIFLGCFQSRCTPLNVQPQWCGEVIQGLEELSRKDSQFGWSRALIGRFAQPEKFEGMDTRYLVRLIGWLHGCDTVDSQYLTHALGALLVRRDIDTCSNREVLSLLQVLSDGPVRPQSVALRVLDEAVKQYRLESYDSGDKEVLIGMIQRLQPDRLARLNLTNVESDNL